MPNLTTGDMSLFFQTSRQTIEIKNRLQTLTKEMSSGEIDDLGKALQGDTRRLVSLDREIARIDGYARSAQDLSRMLTHQQINLTAMNDMRIELSTEFLSVSSGNTDLLVADSAENARSAFATFVSRLNDSVGDRSLFAGLAVDGPALAPAEDMLADMAAAIGGATTTAAIGAALDTWFDDPAGGFATMGYLGDSGPLPNRQIDEFQTVPVTARADDPAIRETLKALATAAMADVLGGGLTAGTRRELVQQSGTLLNAASGPLILFASRVGEVEARVDEILAMQSSKRASFAMARNDLTLVDPYETAVELQKVQTQLEIQFNMTARLSGLSLANYI